MVLASSIRRSVRQLFSLPIRSRIDLHIEKHDGIAAPRTLQIRFKLALARLHPWAVVFLSDCDIAVAEQDGNFFRGHACQQQLNRERVPKAVRAAVLNASEREQFSQRPLPTTDSSVQRRIASPEEVPIAQTRRIFQGFCNEIRYNAVHRLASFLRVEKNLVTDEPVYSKAGRVADPQSGVAEEENEGSKTQGIRTPCLAGLVRVVQRPRGCLPCPLG